MIALDTNILARYLLKDDAGQFKKAKALLAGPKEFTAPISVMLELVWVLRVNDCDRAEITRALRLLIGLPNFKPHHPTALLYALKWFEEGMDFADALHLAMCDQDEAMTTFDRDFAKMAKKSGAFPEVRAL